MDGNEEQEENKDNAVYPDDIAIEMDTKKDDELPSSPIARQHGDNDAEEVNVQSQEHNLQGKIFGIYHWHFFLTVVANCMGIQFSYELQYILWI